MDFPAPPRAAACPNEPRELPTATAHEVFQTAGFGAAAGFPLPTGFLPVAAGDLGIVQMRPLEWDSYVNLCHGEQLARLAAMD